MGTMVYFLMSHPGDKLTRNIAIGLGVLFLVVAPLLGFIVMMYENFWDYGSYKKLIPGIILIIVLCFVLPATPLFEPIKKYADFNGLASRSEFWKFYLTSFIYVVVFQIADWFGGLTSMIFYNGVKLEFADAFLAVLLFQLFIFIPSFAIGARRLHEIGKSGWWQLLTLTGIGIILLIIWWSQEASVKQSKNRFSKATDVNVDVKLRELNKLYKDGVITKKEFSDAKKKYL